MASNHSTESGSQVYWNRLQDPVPKRIRIDYANCTLHFNLSNTYYFPLQRTSMFASNNKTKNLLLPNIGISNVLRNNGDDIIWICHEQDRSWSASSSKSNIQFVNNQIVLHWEGLNSSIQSVIEVNEHLMAFK